jgi:DNA-directed RNA polymerase subunit RPC12/RpoP
VESRIEVSWICPLCEVEGQDTQEYADARPTCWNCGGQVVVTARPTVRTGSGPGGP